MHTVPNLKRADQYPVCIGLLRIRITFDSFANRINNDTASRTSSTMDRPVASLNSQGGSANIYNTYIYIIHVFRGGTESNFKSLGALPPRPPLG